MKIKMIINYTLRLDPTRFRIESLNLDVLMWLLKEKEPDKSNLPSWVLVWLSLNISMTIEDLKKLKGEVNRILRNMPS